MYAVRIRQIRHTADWGCRISRNSPAADGTSTLEENRRRRIRKRRTYPGLCTGERTRSGVKASQQIG